MKTSTILNFLVCAICVVFCQTTIQAQVQESLKGKIIDAETGEPLVEARIKLKNTAFYTISDIDGNYVFKNLPTGKYTLLFNYIGYEKDSITDLAVHSDKSVELTLKLKQTLLEVVTIEAVRNKANTMALVADLQKSESVVSGISAEQISKSQDRDAGEVARRIPGVSIVDSRFIQVRGLSDRYNAVWVNDITAPSAETDKKAFSFDLLPGGLIERIMVYKTPSAELPGDFAGGAVKIYTKNSPTGKEVDFSYGLGFRSGTTGNAFTLQTGNGLSAITFGDSFYDLPNNMPVLNSNISVENLNNNQKRINNTWLMSKTLAAPDQRVSFNFMDSYKIGSLQLSSISSINYSLTNQSNAISRNVFDINGEQTAILADQRSAQNARIGLLQNFSLFLPKNYGRIEWRNFLNRSSVSQVTERLTADNTQQITERNYCLGYQSRTVYSGQIAGTHTLAADKTWLDWTSGYTYSQKNEPDLRRATYAVGKDGMGNPIEYIKTPASGQVDPINAGRLFQKLDENTVTLQANIKQKISNELTIQAGTFIENKNRNFDARAFGYSPNDNYVFFTQNSTLPLDQIFDANHIGGTGFSLLEDINKTYQYAAKNNLTAAYITGTYEFMKKITAVAGVRYEHNVQALATQSISGDPINPSVTTSFFLPSLNVAYRFNQQYLVRGAYGRTVNRPEFREWAPFYYYDFDFSALNFGSLYLNPNSPLKVATIDNYDLRFEAYPQGQGELLHVGVFYKKFKDPIESTVVPNPNLAYSFHNAPEAVVMGVEVEIRKNLHILDSLFHTKQFSNFAVGGNVSVLYSKVTQPANAVSWDGNRPLQGQSPYVINGGIYYTNPKYGVMANLQYNVFGPRIIFVGSDTYPDVVEMPRHTLDVTVGKDFGKHVNIQVGIQDLLNQPVQYVQDFNKDKNYSVTDPRILNFARGTYYTAGVKLRF